MAVSEGYIKAVQATINRIKDETKAGYDKFQEAWKNVFLFGRSADGSEFLTTVQQARMQGFWPENPKRRGEGLPKTTASAQDLTTTLSDPVLKTSHLALDKLRPTALKHARALDAADKYTPEVIEKEFNDIISGLIKNAGGLQEAKDIIKKAESDDQVDQLFEMFDETPKYSSNSEFIAEIKKWAGVAESESTTKEKVEQKPTTPPTPPPVKSEPAKSEAPAAPKQTPAAPATEKKEKPTPTPSAVATSAVEKTEKEEPKVPTAAAVLSVESEAESAEAASTSTRVKNAPVAPSPGVLLGEPPAGKPAEPQVSQTTTINNFNTQAGVAPASDDQTKAKSILEEQLRKLEEMKSVYREEEKIVKSTETARSIAASPSTALAEINKRFDRTETGKEGGAEEAPKSRFAGIKASILKGASSLGSLMSGLLSPTPKGEEAQAGGTSAVTKVQDYIKSALGKGFSPGEVTGFEPASEKFEPAVRVKQVALDVKGAGPAQPKEPLSPMGVADKMAAESGSTLEEFSPAEIGTQEILNKAGEESPDVLKMGNFESTLKIEPNMLQSPAAGAGSTNLSTSVSNEQSNVKVKSSNPISNRSLVNNVLNPPNPVVAEVKGLNKTISSTSEKMNSSIEKISTSSVKEAAIPLTPGSQNLTTNNSTFNQMSGMQEESEKREQGQGEQSSMDDGLSSYYLQAIYDALVVQGIKIRTI